jgi:hypothetical protein
VFAREIEIVRAKNRRDARRENGRERQTMGVPPGRTSRPAKPPSCGPRKVQGFYHGLNDLSAMKKLAHLTDWRFQHTLPVILSSPDIK